MSLCFSFRFLFDIYDILISYILIHPLVWGRTRAKKHLVRMHDNIDHLPP